MKFNRSSGILLHPTSLPGSYGIGELGAQAFRFLDFLAEAGCSLWQVLPLGPTGYGDSPYQCFSAFAGNPYLISLQSLLDEGLLGVEDVAEMPKFPLDRVDFGAVIPWKLQVLDRAYTRFQKSASQELMGSYERFKSAQAGWLDDFALFMALKEANQGAPWPTWEVRLRDRDEKALAQARTSLASDIDRQMFRQFIFFKQWLALRDYAHKNGIQIIGDAPIFVAHDSADVWAHPELFYLNEIGQPKVVAGVPPDYFSPTGQLWGNPLYNWKNHQSSGYQWWVKRIQALLGMVDIIRLDHFRGFAGYWEVSGKAKTAEKGRWVPAPGMDFFKNLRKSLGDLPVIAEDLGVITPDVVRLRDTFSLPGMKIFQFGFGSGPSAPFLPHHYPENCIVYTGTHDNDTARGWYERVPESEKDFFRRYLASDGENVAWDMIRGSWASVAVFALAPMQDLLNLGNSARMNYPGNAGGNWTWRMLPGALTKGLSRRMADLNYLYSRMNATLDSADQKEKPEL